MVVQDHEKSGEALFRAAGAVVANGSAAGTDGVTNGGTHPREANAQRSRRDRSAPARQERVPYAWGRSDGIALASMFLLLLTVVARLQYPELAKELALELRYMLGLLASCFMLGISGWFPSGERAAPKLDAIYTLLVLIVLVAMWDFLLSGSLHHQFRGLIDAITQLGNR